MSKKRQNGTLKITKRDGKIYGDIYISVDIDSITKLAVAAAEESYNKSAAKTAKTTTSNKSKSKKSSATSGATVTVNATQRKGEFGTIMDTDEKMDLFFDTAERVAPQCVGITQLAKKVSDIVLTPLADGKTFNFVKGTPDDNVRSAECATLKGNIKSVSDRANDRVFKINVRNTDGSYSEKIINNPTAEALERYNNQYEEVDNPEDPSGVTHKLVQRPLDLYDGFEEHPGRTGDNISPEAQHYLDNLSDEEIQNYLKKRNSN